MVHGLQFLILLAKLQFCLILNFLNLACIRFFDSPQDFLSLILTFAEVIVSEAELLIDLLIEARYLSVKAFRQFLELYLLHILQGLF